MTAPEERPLIDLSQVRHPVKRLLWPVFGPLVERALKIDELNEFHRKLARKATPETLWKTVLDQLKCGYEVSESDLERIPKQGPVVVVSNHPLGGLDGVVLGHLLQRIRPGAKLMGNYLLSRICHAETQLILVDPFSRQSAAKRNIKPLRESLKFLKGGGLLGIFPGNRVSHYQKDRDEVCDADWVPHIAALIRKTQATVVPVFIDDANSPFFSRVGAWHSIIRTLLMPREFLNRGMTRRPIPIRVGVPIPAARLRRFETDEAMIRFLRTATYFLRHRAAAMDIDDSGKPASMAPLAQKPVVEDLEADLKALTAEGHLLTQGDCEVYVGRYQELPHVMQEIGRGREASFRFVGGGTGQPVDLAPEDEHYLHLFVWNRTDRAVVGAYRLGLGNEILCEHGPEGLVCNKLFEFEPLLLSRLKESGLELGRSYVLPEYQKNYGSLLLLWGGILSFIARHPRYCTIFGSVGISQGDEFSLPSRALIVDHLMHHHSSEEWAPRVRARSPFEAYRFATAERADLRQHVVEMEDVSLLVASLEPDSKGVPVLIRHYLKMNAELLQFGVWKDHSGAVVAFMLQNLKTADPKFIKRYMGAEAYDRFMKHPPAASTEEPRGQDADLASAG